MTGLLSLKDFIEVRKAILADLSGDCLTGNKEGLVNRAFHELKYGRQPKASIFAQSVTLNVLRWMKHV